MKQRESLLEIVFTYRSLFFWFGLKLYIKEVQEKITAVWLLLLLFFKQFMQPQHGMFSMERIVNDANIFTATSTYGSKQLSVEFSLQI